MQMEFRCHQRAPSGDAAGLLDDGNSIVYLGVLCARRNCEHGGPAGPPRGSRPSLDSGNFAFFGEIKVGRRMRRKRLRGFFCCTVLKV